MVFTIYRFNKSKQEKAVICTAIDKMDLQSSRTEEKALQDDMSKHREELGEV